MPYSPTRSKSIYSLRNPDGHPFQYAPEIDPELEIIGLVLWVTEGDRSQLSLANGNETIITKYLEFLRRVCNLREEKIKAVIHCHNSVPYEECLRFWSQVTLIPLDRFNKPFVKPDLGGTRKYPHGILRVVANNIELVQLFKLRLLALGLDRC